MDDNQLALLLTAMSDQTAAMNRMADAMTGILLHLDPKQAAKFAAPGYMRPLAAYASFDWNSIDAHVIAFDRHGATEVEHNGVAYRRYRSNDDDPKGIDIRFRRVVSGTPEGKDMIWATLIKFADKRQKDPPRPIRGELAEKLEQAAAAAAQPANAPAPLPAPAPAAIADKSNAWQAAGIAPSNPPPATEAPALAPVSDVNRAAVSSLQAWLDDPAYFTDKAKGAAREKAAAVTAREQLIARDIDPEKVKAELAEKKSLPFVKAAVKLMREHDEKAPHETEPVAA